MCTHGRKCLPAVLEWLSGMKVMPSWAWASGQVQGEPALTFLPILIASSLNPWRTAIPSKTAFLPRALPVGVSYVWSSCLCWVGRCGFGPLWHWVFCRGGEGWGTETPIARAILNSDVAENDLWTPAFVFTSQGMNHHVFSSKNLKNSFDVSPFMSMGFQKWWCLLTEWWGSFPKVTSVCLPTSLFPRVAENQKRFSMSYVFLTSLIQVRR